MVSIKLRENGICVFLYREIEPKYAVDENVKHGVEPPPAKCGEWIHVDLEYSYTGIRCTD